jgi:uncharacterized membrane protein YeiH
VHPTVMIMLCSARIGVLSVKGAKRLLSPVLNRDGAVVSVLIGNRASNIRFCSTATPSNSAAGTPAASPREGLPRWPQINTSTGILRGLDYFGTAVFAVSGSLTAAASGCDLLGCAMIGTITAVGGGTIRDALVLKKQPFWTEEWEYLIISVAAAAGAFYFWGDLEPGKEVANSGLTLKASDGGEGDLMNWGDAIGVGAFAVIGAMNGIRANSPLIVSGICGMMTSTFGGATRDTLLNRPVRILHPYSDTYAPIAFVTACNYLAMRKVAPAAQGLRIFTSVGLAVLLRYSAWTYGWRLPHWQKNSQSVVVSNKDPR